MRPSMPRISRALHATIRAEPSLQSQRDSRRSEGTPFAAELIAIPARYRSSGCTSSSRLRPVTSSRFQPSCALERRVRAVLVHGRVVPDADEEDRDRVRDRAGEVALHLQLELPLAPVGDVEPAADHVADVALLVVERRGRPRDRDLLARSVHERVLEVGRRVEGRGLLESRRASRHAPPARRTRPRRAASAPPPGPSSRSREWRRGSGSRSGRHGRASRAATARCRPSSPGTRAGRAAWPGGARCRARARRRRRPRRPAPARP